MSCFFSLVARHSANQNRTASEFRPQITLNPAIRLNINEAKSPLIPSSITTANLSMLSSSPAATPPPRSTTMAQISPDDAPPSPDDDDELERRSKLRMSYQNSPTSAPLSTPVKRLCLWQNHIAQTTDDDQQAGPNTKSSSSSSSTSTVSRLTNLNLSYNRFDVIPPMLCCLVPYLTSLNLSHNLLSDPSNISSYPPRLKTLDLSFNHLQYSIQVDSSANTPRREKLYRKNRHNETTTTSDNICYRPELKESNAQVDLTKRRRSRSVSRHKVLASTTLSTGGNSPAKSDQTEQCCPHRRHTKLEFLNDLNLSDNILGEVTLSVCQEFFSFYLTSICLVDIKAYSRYGYRKSTLISAISSSNSS